jgi:hypothetical protein
VSTLSEVSQGNIGWVFPPQPQTEVVEQALGVISGFTQLIEDQDYVDVAFSSDQPTSNWTSLGMLIVNTLDSSVINVWPGVVSSKTASGFRLQLNGTPDSGNYYLRWSIRGVFGYTIDGPVSGNEGVASTPFTAKLVSGVEVDGTVIVTPHASAAGTFTPSSVSLTNASPSATFTFTPPTSGVYAIGATNNKGLVDAQELSYQAYTNLYTLSGPSSGTQGVESTNFTVALPVGGIVSGAVTVTPSDGGDGGTFTPSTVDLTTVAPSQTFTYTPASEGTKTISVTNSGGLTNPGNLTYVSLLDPSTIAGLKMWLKADAIVGSDGDLLTSWNDSSANNYDVGNFGGADRPTLKTNIVNGNPVVRFDGVGNFLANASSIGVSQPNTVFIVAKKDAAGTNARWSESYPPAPSPQILYLDTSGYFSLYAGSGIVQDAVNRAGAFHVFTGILNGASSHTYVDGTLKASGNPGTNGVGNVGMMVDAGTSEFNSGDIAEILIYNSALSNTDRGNVEAYLKAKYATP